MPIADYITTSSVEEALAALAASRGEARVIAGGTDLMIQIRGGQRSPRALIDITRIAELQETTIQDGYLKLGSANTFSQIESSPLVAKHARVLSEAAAWVGSPQIRNVATLGGNVVNAMPAADGSIALLALGAEVQIANLTGRQWVDLPQVFVEPGVSRVDASSEILASLRIPIDKPRVGSAYERLARRKAMALPIISVGVLVTLEADSATIHDARIAIGPVAPVPFRSRAAESGLRGQPAEPSTLDNAAEAAAADARPRSSLLRAGKEYRAELVRVLVRRALARAIERARGTADA